MNLKFSAVSLNKFIQQWWNEIQLCVFSCIILFHKCDTFWPRRYGIIIHLCPFFADWLLLYKPREKLEPTASLAIAWVKLLVNTTVKKLCWTLCRDIVSILYYLLLPVLVSLHLGCIQNCYYFVLFFLKGCWRSGWAWRCSLKSHR